MNLRLRTTLRRFSRLDEYRGTETLWGSVTQAPDRTSEIMAAMNLYEKLPDGSSIRMSGGFAEYDADGKLLRSKATEDAP